MSGMVKAFMTWLIASFVTSIIVILILMLNPDMLLIPSLGILMVNIFLIWAIGGGLAMMCVWYIWRDKG